LCRHFDIFFLARLRGSNFIDLVHRGVCLNGMALDYKCIAFYKFYTQTEANFYEKQDRSRPDIFDC
jgi:hypothetical protein